MSGHFDNKRMWNKKGVSEVIGTILILAITVVLFSGVIFMVGNIPTPKSNVNSSLTGTIEAVNGDWTQGAWVNVSNGGGVVLRGAWTDIVLIVGDSSTHHRTTSFTPVPGIDGDADEDWETGETWHYLIGPGVLTATTPVSVMIVAEDRSAIVWQADLHEEGSNNYPPVIMTAWVTSELSDLQSSSIQYNKDFVINARVVDFDGTINPNFGLDTNSVYVDMTSFGIGTIHLLDPNLDGIFTATAAGPTDRNAYQPGNHPAIITANDLSLNYTSKTVYIPLGGDFAGMPMITIVQRPISTGYYDRNITFGDDTLVHNKRAEITATIFNYGASVEAAAYFYDNATTNPNGSLNTGNLIGGRFVPLLLHANAQVRAYMEWTPAYGGIHNILVNVVPITPALDGDFSNNWANISVTVLPTILLVDDDGHANDRTELDTSSFMRASLSAGNFDYDFVSIAVGDGPGYNTGDFKMINYDVVVWMCGYTTNNTLTALDVSNLKKFLTTGTNAGSLWLIGQGTLADAGPAAFAQQNLGVGSWALRNPMSKNLTGIAATDPVAGYLSTGTIDIVSRGTAPTNGYAVTTLAALPPSFKSLVNPVTPSDAYGIGAANEGQKSRTYFTPWEFSRIKETSDQAQLAYQVIRWLGDINSSFGRDLSVSEQTVDKNVVYFHQPVSISGIVRNNGMQNETNVDVSVTIYYNGIPTVLPEQAYTVNNTVGNNWISVGPFLWTPENVGSHTIVLMVDPHNNIPESNEDNNVVSNYLSSGNINVQFRMLVVDDDESPNNYGARTNDTQSVTNTFKALGYFNESKVVNTTQAGPAYSYLKDFNAVIWSTGSAPNALLAQDMENLTTYLNGGGRLWLTGRNGLSTGASAFQQNYLGAASAIMAVTPSTLLGVDGHPVSHGDRYRLNNAVCQHIVPTVSALPAFRQNASAYNAVTLSISGFKTVTTGFAFSDITGSTEFPGDSNARTELAYMVMHWFGSPDARVEFRTTLSDFSISSARPQLGDSYVLQARVSNVGGSDGNCLVRFMDGTTQIGSDSITVTADGYTTAEVIWTPLFAGQRTLYVYVDPINETAEIIDWFNNRISYSTYVYFFYDDMESGTSKWQHDSTITLINGEQPLDYISNTVVTMNIEKDWDSAFSVNANKSHDVGFYHTYNTSYWLQEPAGTGTVVTTPGVRKPVDVVFALDTSGSMAGTKLTNLKTATTNFIGKLTATDRAGIWTFNAGGSGYPQQRYNLTYMTAANRATFNATINGLAATGSTPFYDTLGAAILDSKQFDLTCTDTARLEYVIGLTDGASNEDRYWSPNANWGATVWTNQYTWDGNSHTMHGLIGCPPMTYTIGLSLGTDHWAGYPADGNPWPGYLETYTDVAGHPLEYDLWHSANSTPQTKDSAVTTPANYGWNNSANWSRPNIGHYFHCTDPTKLGAIFTSILTSIQSGSGNVSGENITRSGNWQPSSYPVQPPTRSGGGDGSDGLPPGPEINAIRVYNYAGVTAANGPPNAWFDDLDDSTQAELTGPSSQAEFTDAYYANTVSSNNVRAGPSADPGFNDHMGVEYEYNIAELPTDITQIDLTHEAQYSAAGAVVTIYAWNTVTNNWDAIGTTMTFTNAATDYTMNRSITVTPGNYISATGSLFWIAYPSIRATVSVDYSVVVITYTARPNVWITGIAPATPSSNAAPTVSYAWGTTVPTSVQFYYTTNGGTTWSAIPPAVGSWGTDATVDSSWASSALPADGTYHFSARGMLAAGNENVPSGAASIEWGPWVLDRVRPTVIITQPANASTNVPTAQNVLVTFSESMFGGVIPTIAGTPAATYTNAGWVNATTYQWTHTAWAYDTDYALNVTGARDLAGNFILGVHAWTFHTAKAGTATATGPTNAIAIATANPTITYSYEGFPTSVEIYYTSDSGLTWTYWGTDATVDGSWPATSNLPASGTYGWYARAIGGGSTETLPGSMTQPEAQPYNFDNTAPFVQGVNPSSGLTNVARGALVKVRFSERMRTSVAPTVAGGAVAYTFSGWTTTGATDDTAMWTHVDWASNTFVTMTVSGAQDYAGNAMSPAIYTWSFTTGTETGTGGSGGTNPGVAPPGTNSNKSAVTKTMDLRNLQEAELSFWHKYNIVPGVNGGVLMVGYMESNLNPNVQANWKWRYVVPSSAYTGNLRLNLTVAQRAGRTDSMGTYMQWGWNGVSGRGTFAWEKVSVDILPWVNQTGIAGYNPLSAVRVKFQYFQYGGGTGYGWYIDDVKVAVSRGDSTAVAAASADAWQLTNTSTLWPGSGTIFHSAHSGTHAWWNGNVTTGFMKKGIDNSLLCGPIDLTNARNATLGAYFKFNINTKDGAPPDGFRVEISRDNGVTWSAINLGVRAAWNVSGYETDASDGKTDGKSYTGLPTAGYTAAQVGYWVSAGTCTRLNVDLSSFTGNAIMMRFRMVTNAAAAYLPYKLAAGSFPAGSAFGGFYVDDVTVMGNTILG